METRIKTLKEATEKIEELNSIIADAQNKIKDLDEAITEGVFIDEEQEAKADLIRKYDLDDLHGDKQEEFCN